MGPSHLLLHTKYTGLREGSVGPHWRWPGCLLCPGPELSLMKPPCDWPHWEGVGSRPYTRDLGTERKRSPHLGGPTAGVLILFLTVMSRAFLRNSRQESMESRPMSGGEGASRGLEERSGKNQQDCTNHMGAPGSGGETPQGVSFGVSVIAFLLLLRTRLG